MLTHGGSMKHIYINIILIILISGTFSVFCSPKRQLKLTRWEQTCLEWFIQQRTHLIESEEIYKAPGPDHITLPYPDEFELIDRTIKDYVAPVYKKFELHDCLHYNKNTICSLLLKIKLLLDARVPIKNTYEQWVRIHLFEAYHR